MRECTETCQVQCNVLTLSYILVPVKYQFYLARANKNIHYRYNGGNNNMYVNFIMHALLTYFTANAGYV